MAAVQPAFQRLHAEDDARRIAAEIPLPHLEFQVRQRGFQLGAVDPLLRQPGQLVKDRLLGGGL